MCCILAHCASIFAERKLIIIVVQNNQYQFIMIQSTKISVTLTPELCLEQALREAGVEDPAKPVLSGFTKLDEKTGGWQSGDFVIVASRPSMGKTAFALSMARNMAMDYGCGVAIFSLEMNEEQMLKRMMITEAASEKDKKPANNVWMHYISQTEKLLKAPLFIDDTPALSTSDFCRKLRQFVKMHNVRIAIIDYLHLMTYRAERVENHEREILKITQTLKETAVELNIPIIALSQLNRSEKNRADKRPVLSDLRDVGTDQYADTVILINRHEYYGITEDDEGNSLRGVADLIIAQNRNGVLGDVRLNFNKEIAKFENL